MKAVRDRHHTLLKSFGLFQRKQGLAAPAGERVFFHFQIDSPGGIKLGPDSKRCSAYFLIRTPSFEALCMDSVPHDFTLACRLVDVWSPDGRPLHTLQNGRQAGVRWMAHEGGAYRQRGHAAGVQEMEMLLQ